MNIYLTNDFKVLSDRLFTSNEDKKPVLIGGYIEEEITDCISLPSGYLSFFPNLISFVANNKKTLDKYLDEATEIEDIWRGRFYITLASIAELAHNLEVEKKHTLTEEILELLSSDTTKKAYNLSPEYFKDFSTLPTLFYENTGLEMIFYSLLPTITLEESFMKEYYLFCKKNYNFENVTNNNSSWVFHIGKDRCNKFLRYKMHERIMKLAEINKISSINLIDLTEQNIIDIELIAEYTCRGFELNFN